MLAGPGVIGAGFALPRDAGPHRENWPEVGVPSRSRACVRAAMRVSPRSAGRCRSEDRRSLTGALLQEFAEAGAGQGEPLQDPGDRQLAVAFANLRLGVVEGAEQVAGRGIGRSRVVTPYFPDPYR